MAEQMDVECGWSDGAHPLLTASTRLHRVLDEAHGAVAAGSDPGWLPAADQGVLLEQLARAKQRLDALLIGALAATEQPNGVASLDGSRSPADWLAHTLHVRPGRLVADERLGAAVADRQLLAAALAAGELTVEHARAVVDVLAELPADDLEPSVLLEAERVMVGHCAGFTPPEVRRLGRHLLEVVAPEVSEKLEAKRLAESERNARRRTRLSIRRTSEGTRLISGEIPELHASILESALRAIANPRRHDGEEPADDGRRPTHPQRMGHAFCALIERLPTDGLPTHGRNPVTVTVTVSEANLRRDGAGIGLLDNGAEVSPGELRRLLCQQGIMPVVMGGRSEVLDLGREQRFYTGHQIAAMKVAHPECQAAGCTIPASHCEAHHRRRWSDGGPTDLADGALLCSWHHHRAHDPRYETGWAADGTATFHRRC